MKLGKAQSEPSASEFVNDAVGAVDNLQGLSDRIRMHRNGAALLIGVDVVAGQRLNVAVKNQANEFSSLVDNRTAGISSDDVGRTYEIERRRLR